MSKKTFYITTPIYYPSGDLHIGHVYTTTLARTLANYKEKMGYETKFLTGSDEHGQKIQEKAELAGIKTQDYVDQMVVKFKNLWELLGIEYDYFSRTTNENHKQAVSKQFTQLFEKGDIYKGEYKGLYSVSDEEYLTELQAEKKDGKFYHPVSGHELQEVSEESYFFKMSEYQEWWNDYIKENPQFIIPEKIINELKNNFVDKGLSDLSVTRSSFEWGVNIKEDEKHVIYVWMDALNNYITALGYNSDDDSDYQKYWVEGDEIVHLVGKEITRFHGIYWPIILKAADLRLPTTILSHGWIVTPEGKMSKSKGNVIDPIYLIDKYGAEVLKYFFASKISMGKDGVFDEEMLKNVFNADLANNYGNLLSRTVAMTLQNFDSPIKHVSPTKDVDKDILKSIESSFKEYKEQMDEFQIHKAFDAVVYLGKNLNGYIDATEPWKLKEDKVRLAEVLNNLLNGIYAMSAMFSVVIPNKADEARKSLNVENLDFDQILNFEKFDNVLPIKADPLFERLKK